jgi:hypothetical protein
MFEKCKVQTLARYNFLVIVLLHLSRKLLR